ncbi:hypothetical protein BDZ88DRAFT_141867 [Geranomyces variabilis]|nr:hypothetical protein BDZ88DRAFT_141867 [Geranomyces variabilis]
MLKHMMVRPTVSPEERAIIEIRSEMMRPSKDIDSNAIAECRAHESRGYPFTGKSIFQIVDLDRRGVLWWAAHYGLPKTFAYVMHHASIEDLNAQSNEEAPSMSIPGLMIEHPALQWSMFSLCRKNATPIFKHWMASQPKTMAYIYEQLHSKLLKITAPPTQGQHGRGRIVFWLLLCLYSITDNILGQDASLTKKLLKQFQNRSFELFAKDQPLASTLEQRRAVMVCINTLCKAAHSPDLVVRVPLSLVPRLLHTKGIHSAFHEDALNISVLKLDIVIDAGAGLAADCSKAIAALADVFQTGNLTEVRLKAQ